MAGGAKDQSIFWWYLQHKSFWALIPISTAPAVEPAMIERNALG
jgi:hypothetical protein